MHSFALLSSLAISSLLARQVAAECISYGTDFVDGGGPYCIDLYSTDYLSFGNYFEGCTTDDNYNGVIQPIVIDPNGDSYICSSVALTPNDAVGISTCNVAGNELSKYQMIPGTWLILTQGYTFSWQRSFDIIAALSVTSTTIITRTTYTTPTMSATVTVTALTTTTVPTPTSTVPGGTLTFKTTITPAPTTKTVTSVVSVTTVSTTSKTTTKTMTSTTTSCTKAAKRSEVTAMPELEPRSEEWMQMKGEEGKERRARGVLQARGADACTTIFLDSTVTTSTTTMPATTVTLSISNIITSTVTPATVTITGTKTSVTTTITAAGSTATTTVKSTATSTVWSTTYIATVTTVVKVNSAGATCVAARRH